MTPAPLRHRNVYVVGGSLGIGLAVAKAFAARGADVVVCARRAAVLEQAVSEIRGVCREASQRIEGLVLDAGDADQVRETLPRAVERFGAPDVLVNCVGRARPAPFENVDDEQFWETLRINLASAWNTVQALLPFMRERGGTIVNTSSLAGLIGVFGYTDYSAAKFAVVGFSEALRSELKRFGIDVVVLCPPDTDTPGLAEEDRSKPPETRAVSAGARCMSAEAVAQALLRGLEQRRRLIVPGGSGRLAVWARRWFPALVEWAMDRAVRRAQREAAAAQGAQPSQGKAKRST